MDPNNPYGPPQEVTSGAAGQVTRFISVNRIDPISAGTVMGALQVILGLIIGAMFAFFAMIGISLVGADAVPAGVAGGIIAMLIFPIMYGVMGFVAGLIGAVLYNLAASVVGGIKVELKV